MDPLADVQKGVRKILILGVASIVVSILGVGCGPAFFAGPVLGVAAVVRSIKHLRYTNAGVIPSEGKGYAIAGGVAGALGIVAAAASAATAIGLALLFL